MKRPMGVIGGMGPFASQVFYKLVTEHTEALRDQEHIDMVILSVASMPDRTEAILGGDTEPIKAELLEDMRLLKHCGCRTIAVPCNTAHFFLDKIELPEGMELINMIRETAEVIVGERGAKKAGIMATDGTIRSGLYQRELEKRGIETVAAGKDIQKEIMHQIYDCVKRGRPYDSESFGRIEAFFRDAGCDTVILGCTELSVINDEEKLPDLYVDPMLILAKRLIEAAGKGYKE